MYLKPPVKLRLQNVYLFIVLLTGMILFPVRSASADKTISAAMVISSNETWNENIIITGGPVTVQSGAVLTINGNITNNAVNGGGDNLAFINHGTLNIGSGTITHPSGEHRLVYGENGSVTNFTGVSIIMQNNHAARPMVWSKNGSVINFENITMTQSGNHTGPFLRTDSGGVINFSGDNTLTGLNNNGNRIGFRNNGSFRFRDGTTIIKDSTIQLMDNGTYIIKNAVVNFQNCSVTLNENYADPIFKVQNQGKLIFNQNSVLDTYGIGSRGAVRVDSGGQLAFQWPVELKNSPWGSIYTYSSPWTRIYKYWNDNGNAEGLRPEPGEFLKSLILKIDDEDFYLGNYTQMESSGGNTYTFSGYDEWYKSVSVTVSGGSYTVEFNGFNPAEITGLSGSYKMDEAILNGLTEKDIDFYEIQSGPDYNDRYHEYTVTNRLYLPELTLEWDTEGSFPYDGEVHKPVLKSAKDSKGKDYVGQIAWNYTYSSERPVNAGSYTARVTLPPELRGYTIANPEKAEINYEITKAAAAVKVSGNSFRTVYNGREQSAAGYTLRVEDPLGRLSEEDILYNGEAAAKGRNAGTYSMGLKKESFSCTNRNYSVSFTIGQDGVLEILPKTAKLSWKDLAFVYDRETHLPSAEVTNLENGDTCQVTVEGAAALPGTYEAKAVGLSSGNYALPQDDSAKQSFTISKKAAEIAWGKTSFIYNGQEQCPAASVTNAEGEDVQLVIEGARIEANAEGETYTAVITGISGDHYALPTEGLQMEFTIAKAELREGQDFNAPLPVDGLVYNRSGQDLITGGTWIGSELGTFEYRTAGYVSKDPAETDFSANLPSGMDAGTYTIEWRIRGDSNHLDHGPETLQAVIARKDLADCGIRITPDGSGHDDPDVSTRFIVTDADGNLLIEGTDHRIDRVDMSGMTHGFYTVFIEGLGNYSGTASADLPFGSYKINAPEEIAAGESVTVSLEMDPFIEGSAVRWLVSDPDIASISGNGERSAVISGRKNGSVLIIAEVTLPDGSVFTIRRSLLVRMQMFRLIDPQAPGWDPAKDLPWHAGHKCLPATGFPTKGGRLPYALSVKPVKYTDLRMRIQIPQADLDIELVGVPETEQEWLVGDLGSRAGLLSGTALPGSGISIIAAHNHLNESENGPFLVLSTLTDNDVIFINRVRGMMPFRVYANELVEPDDFRRLAEIVEEDPNTLMLVTCEEEMADGGYQYRRVVFAKPL